MRGIVYTVETANVQPAAPGGTAGRSGAKAVRQFSCKGGFLEPQAPGGTEVL